MKPITAPITREEPRENRAAEVTNLQEGLLLLLRKGVIRLEDRQRRSFEETVLIEQREELYGDATEKLLSIFQDQHRERFRLEPSGKVDEPTAQALNNLLSEHGAFGMPDQPAVVPQQHMVEGTVFSPDRAGVGGLVVVIVDKNAGPDVPLAEARTDERGRYSVSIPAATVAARRKKQPDLQARVHAREKFLAASEVRYHASTHEVLDVLLPAKAAALPSEHETLTGALAAHFTGKLGDLKEDDERQDITYLANKTGWDARAVAMAALAEQASQRTIEGNEPGITAPLFYALFRAGLPTEGDALYLADSENVVRVWKQAIDQGVIPSAAGPQIDGAIKAFQKIGSEKLLTGPATTGLSSMKEMLAVSGIPAGDPRQRQFVELYTAHRADPTKFWGKVATALGDAPAKRLQVDGKLAYLTVNNAPLMQALHEDIDGTDGVTDPLQLAQAGYHKADKWANLLKTNPGVAIPKEIPGANDTEKHANYAGYQAAMVRLSYPTASVAQSIKSGELPLTENPADAIHGEVHAFLTEHQGKFEIGAQPVEQFIARNELTVPADTVQAVKRVQRVYQITPSDEAMAGLMKRGIDAAYHVVQHDREAFIDTYKDDVGGAENAARTYDRSVEVHNTILNLTIGYLSARTAPAIGVHSPPSIIDPLPVAANTDDVIAYPSLEKLFGSMDFCDCEHCRSILSPAAYLVNLLMFLDRDKAPATGAIPLEVLLERRPDIQHIPLTCENTNTVLPYIDVVNEIMEFFIVNRLSLKEDAVEKRKEYLGHDTGSADSEDLMASPQFVLDTAYATLQGQQFPAPLPFHQPLESLRRYFRKLEAPLPLAMETLRKDDALERGKNTYGWRDILAEEIELSRAEYDLLTTSVTAPNVLTEVYGFTTEDDTAARAYLSNAKRFCRRTEITYDELVAVLQTRFVNPNSDLVPKVGRLHLSFVTLKALKDGTISDADFDKALPTGASAPDPAAFGGDIKAWVKDQDNFDRIMDIIQLAVPTWSASATFLEGDCVIPTAPPAGSTRYYECTKPGTSGTIEPASWPVKADATQADGGIVWTCHDDLHSSGFGTLALGRSDPGRLGEMLDEVAFVRLLRFIRLWKKLGWTIEHTDSAICALLPMPASPLGGEAVDSLAKLDAGFLELLPRIGIVARTMRALNLNVKRDLLPLLTLWSDIGTHGAGALYRRMFLNPTVREQDPVFADDGYGHFLQKPQVPYAQTGDSLDPAIVAAAPKKIGYDATRQRLSFSGSLDPATRDALTAVVGVTADFQTAVDELYAVQFLVTHAAALRGAFNLTDHELSQIAAELKFTMVVTADYDQPKPTLDQAILDVAPGLRFDNVAKRLAHAGVVSKKKGDELKAVVGVTPAFQTAVSALVTNSDATTGADALTPLNLGKVSKIYRWAWLARTLKISVRELLLLSGLTGLDPFAELNPFAEPERQKPGILEIIGLVQAMKERSFKSAAALYLIWNQDLSGKSAPDPVQVAEFARTLRADFVAIDDQFASSSDPGGDAFRNQIAAVYGQEVSDAFFALLDDTLPLSAPYKGDAADVNATTEVLIGAITSTNQRIVYDKFSHLLTHTGVLTDAKRVALQGVAGVSQAFKDAVQVLFDRSEDIRGSFFSRHQELKALSDDFLALKTNVFSAPYEQTAAGLDAAIVAVDSVLTYSAASKTLSYTGMLSADQRDKLNGVKDVTQGFQKAVDALFAAGNAAVLDLFRPGLAQRRKRQQALQRLGAAAGLDFNSTVALMDPVAEPPLAEHLPLHADSKIDKPALDDIIALETQGLEVRFFDGDTVAGASIPTVPTPAIAANLDYSPAVNPLPSNGTNAVSGIWSGHIEVPEAGYYNLVIEAESKTAVTLEIDGKDCPLVKNGNIHRNDGPLELKAGTLYAIRLQVEKVKDTLRVKWETPKRAREVIPARHLYPSSIFVPFSVAYTRFLKATSLAAGLGLTIKELAHFATDPDYNIFVAPADLWLNKLPVSGDTDEATAKALLRPFRALLNFARIKAQLVPDNESLLAILKDPAAATKDSSSLLLTLTRWDKKSLNDLLAHFGSSVDDLKKFDLLRRIHDAFTLLQPMGIQPAALIRATTNEPAGETVRDLQAALRARYDAASWREVVQPINDEMRTLQRDALVAYILHQMRSNPKSDHIDAANKLFEYFLTDVQMEPCMQTSRIRHALSSVQLFVERCLMGLEPRVSLGTIDPKRWEWMKRYRVWEANRKIFLYPENWLEPELRDDKSPFFKEIESELLQSDITEDSAATALLNYLSKLEEVAKLEPCGIHHEEGDAGLRRNPVDHVIARTSGLNRKYYYRNFSGTAWSPWEHIKLDLDDNPVLPVVWKGRLFLFWLRILQQVPLKGPDTTVLGSNNLGASSLSDIKTDAQKSMNISPPLMDVRAIICWSEYYHQKWQPTKTSDLRHPAELGQFAAGEGNPYRPPFRRSEWWLAVGEQENHLRIEIQHGFILGGIWHFIFHNTHALPSGKDEEPLTVSLPFFSFRSFGYNPLTFNYWDPTANIMHPRKVLTKQVGPVSIVAPRGVLWDSWNAPFFLEDRSHVFFVTTKSEPVLIFEEPLAAEASPDDAGGTVSLIIERIPEYEVGPKFWGDGGPIGPDPLAEITNRTTLERPSEKTRNIRQALPINGIVTYGSAKIGLTGSVGNL